MDYKTIKNTLGKSITGQILISWGYVIEITSIYDNLIYGRPFLDENAAILPPDTHKIDLKTMLEYGFTIYTKKEAQEGNIRGTCNTPSFFNSLTSEVFKNFSTVDITLLEAIK
jgi:hypothetical protein